MLDKNQENTEDQVSKTPEEKEIKPAKTPKAKKAKKVLKVKEVEEVEEVEEEKVVKDKVVEVIEDKVVEEAEKDEDKKVVVDKTAANKAVEEIEDKVAEDAEKDEERSSMPMLEYENMELEQLTDELEKLLKDFPVQQLKKNIDAIKNAFNAKFGTELADKKAIFLEEGGNSIDFQYSSPVKATYNSLLSDYKKKRDAYYSDLDTQLKNNLEKRHKVINDLKELIDDAEPKTMYQNFKVIQTSWREIGSVPRNKYNDTWRNYHHHVERFYDLLHLSNDFRDLDFKNNLEEKLKLIEKVEALAELENVNDAFKELQQYHKAWKEDIGPVSQEHREDVWQKFSDASKKIHDKRHDYFRSLKSQYQEIIDVKVVVIQSIEKYDTSKNKKHSDWQKSINDIEALRKQYFDAGKLPYSKSEEVWQKFKKATKKFNAEKNVFYKKEKNVQQDNLDKKNALIELAESFKESEDWESATNTMKKIQSDWKKIGHVPRKFSDDIWKRFKAACNHYFDRFHNRQNDLNKEQQVFIEEKKIYLEEIKKVEKATIDQINEFIQKWKDFGDTPRSVRHLESKFYKQIDKLLEGLSLSKDEIAMLKYKNLIDGLIAQGNEYKLNSEQQFVRKKIDEINKEIQQLENNLSFFSNAKPDNPLVVNVRTNIDAYKEDVSIWIQKLEFIKRLEY